MQEIDFPVTRRLIAQLPSWIDELTAALPQPVKDPLPKGGFRWKHADQTAQVVQLAKAVRMASGIAAALSLADAGFTVESATLLRTISDFAHEVIFIGEGLLTGSMTEAQSKFVSDYFKTLPRSPEELAQRERDYYVGRKDIQKAHTRLAEGSGISPDDLAKITAFLNKGYDSYVHGGYESAMELFTGRDHRFMLAGTESLHNRCVTKVGVAGKLYEVLLAVELIAITWRRQDMVARLRAARKKLDACDEQTGSDCPD